MNSVEQSEYVWAKRIGGHGYADSGTGNGITSLNDGSIIVSGTFDGTHYFGETKMTSKEDSFVAKLDSNGEYVWVKKAGGAANGIASLNDGSTIFTGSFSNADSFGDTNLISYGSKDVYVAKLDSDGNWAETDPTPPVVESVEIEGNQQLGLTLVINFSEDITGLSQALVNNNLSLRAGNKTISLVVDRIRTNSNTLRARIDTEQATISYGDPLTLTYTKPRNEGIADQAGNSLENFEITITNPIPEPEAIAETPEQPDPTDEPDPVVKPDPTVEPDPAVNPDPITGQDTVLANAQINKSATRISLEFTAALSTANTLSPFNFAITGSDGSAIDLRAVSVSKNNANQLNLKLNQGNQLAAGSTVQVAYTQPSNSTALTDAAGQPIESFSQSGISSKGTPVAPLPEPSTPEPTTPESPPAKLAPIAKYDLYQYEGGQDNRTTISFGDSKQRRKRESGVLKNDLNVELDPTKNPTTFVTEIRLGGAADSGKAGIIGQPITGTYGRLTLNADGSYAYNATEQAAADLLIGETGFDDFTYTISDGTNSSSASFSFAIAGSKERPVEPNPDPINPPSTTTPEGNNTPATGTGTGSGTTINIENLTIKLGKGETIDLIGDLISHAKTKGFLSANLFESSATSNQLQAKLPPQLGLSHQGTDAAATRSQAKLILKGIYSTLNSKDRKAHQRDANRYLSGLPGKRSARVDLRSITPESLRNNNQPLKTLGLVGKAKGRNLNEALILDGRNLPSQTNIRLDHIGFLSLFGDIRISSGKGNNHVIGDRAAQTINLGNGDDTVIGGAGQDTLHGGKGNDSLDGGNDDDVLIGGPGADQFRLSKGQDLIEDFNLNQGDLLITSNPGKLSIKQEADNLLITGPSGIDTLLADVDRRAFLAADPFG